MSKQELVFSSDDLIALIPEGKSEAVYLDILLRNNLLKFHRGQLLYDRVLDRVNYEAKKFQANHLGLVYNRKLTVIIVTDRVCNFKVKKPYDEKMYAPIFVTTRPELEMLLIHHHGLYDEYKKSSTNRKGGIKPSDFLGEKLGVSTQTIKSKNYIESTFTPESLIAAIRKYDEKAPKSNQKDYRLIDLLL